MMDWKFYSFLFLVGISLMNLVVLLSVKFNDMKHLIIDVTELKKKVFALIERVSFIEGKLEDKYK